MKLLVKFFLICFFICLFGMIIHDRYVLSTAEPIKVEYFEGKVTNHYHSFKWHFYFVDSKTNETYRVEHGNSRCRISNDRYIKTKEGDYVKIKRITYDYYIYEYEIWYNGQKVDLRVNSMYKY